MNEFIIIKGNLHADTNHAADEEWFSHCCSELMPYVRINIKSTKADIHWDCISINPENIGAVIDNERLAAYLIGVFQVVSDNQSKCDPLSYSGTFYNIPIELAERAAQEVCFGISEEIKEYLSQQVVYQRIE